MNSPDQAEDGFEQTRSRPRVTLGDLRSEDEPGHHSPSHPLPQKGATYPPGPLDEPAQSSRRRTWNGRPADQTDSTDALVQSPTFEARLRRVHRRITNLATPETPVGKPPNFRKQMRNIFWKWINVLLLAIPVSWALHFAVPEQYTLVFVFSFLAIIPLAKLLGYATEELSFRVGETLAGLINATLGNAVELIVAILALIKCELRIVQSSLVGSILSNLLLVLGFCFFAGGTRFSEQGFAVSASQLNSSLLTLSVIGVLIPAAFDMVTGNNQILGFDSDTEQRDILKLSHGTAIVLLFIYLAYLYFQLFSHKNLYNDETSSKPGTVQYAPRDGPTTRQKAKKRAKKLLRLPSKDGDAERQTEEEKEPEEAEPELSLSVAIGLLIVVTVFVAVTAEWLVDSIDGLADSGNISKEFIGLILLPIVGNAAEHVTAVSVSVKDKLTLSLGVAVGSSIQIALFVIPFIVTLGWIIGKPLTMLFDPFESIVLFFSVLTVNYVVQDGKSNWLEGMILICLYVIVALVFWFYPGTQPTGLLTCSVIPG